MLLIDYDPFAALAGFMTIFIVIGVIWCIVSIALCVWVYRDAERREMGGALWLIIVLLTGCIGCIIYLIVRK